MADFDRKALRAIFEGADLEIPPKDVLGKICDLHTSSSDGKDETIKDLKSRLESAEQELDTLKASKGDDYKSKYEKEHSDFEAFKKDVTAKEIKAAKEAAVKAYFESKNITGANLAIAMRGARDEIEAIELDGTSIKDTSALDALVTGEFAGLVVTKTTQGANTATPPANTGGTKLTKADIFKKDEHGHYVMSTAERQKALAENPDLLK